MYAPSKTDYKKRCDMEFKETYNRLYSRPFFWLEKGKEPKEAIKRLS